ncbi:MAG TPA: ABC transporter ATP-binding protein [Steroidobacteraceae bacterium]|jgi:iron complex transport system ATP-binding protein
MSILDASKISVRRGSRTILDDVSLHAESGDFVAVIGANGAGKSTLLSALAGLLRPDSGNIVLDGVSIRALSGMQLAQRRAYLPQNPRCEWPLSVERLVALGLTPILPALGGLPASFAPKITRALQACDLLEHRDQAATTLSGGELARAMLARALVADPNVLIIDEPIAGLDPKHALDTARRLQSLAKGGKLVIASVHDLTLAGRFASRIFALSNGRVAGDGATQATLTPALIRSAFEVEACVSGAPGSVYVDYTLPP